MITASARAEESYRKTQRYVRIVVTIVGVLLLAMGIFTSVWIIMTLDRQSYISDEVISHRVRNELYHECLASYMEAIWDAVEVEDFQRDIPNPCPPALTDTEIRQLAESPEHEGE